jgi:hypothetical protein
MIIENVVDSTDAIVKSTRLDAQGNCVMHEGQRCTCASDARVLAAGGYDREYVEYD